MSTNENRLYQQLGKIDGKLDSILSMIAQANSRIDAMERKHDEFAAETRKEFHDMEKTLSNEQSSIKITLAKYGVWITIAATLVSAFIVSVVQSGGAP